MFRSTRRRALGRTQESHRPHCGSYSRQENASLQRPRCSQLCQHYHKHAKDRRPVKIMLKKKGGIMSIEQ